MNTDSIVDVAEAILQKLQDEIPELQDVYYGDQALIPRTPTACVESGNKTRVLEGASLMTLNTFPVYIMIYHGKVQDSQLTKKECEELAERIELMLHQDVTLGGLVVHGHCTELDPGYAQRDRTMYYVTRITWEGLSKTRLTTRETP